MKCIMCKGELTDKTSNHIADLGDCIVIVKNVPSQVCSQCGKVSYSHDVGHFGKNREHYVYIHDRGCNRSRFTLSFNPP